MPPMWLWEQVLRELGEPLTSSRQAGDTGADRFRMFDAVARQLVGLCAAERAVIVLDDLQWADEESLAFVDFFAPDAEQHGLVVLTTARRGELLHLPRSAVVIELDGLLADEVGCLLTPPAGRIGSTPIWSPRCGAIPAATRSSSARSTACSAPSAASPTAPTGAASFPTGSARCWAGVSPGFPSGPAAPCCRRRARRGHRSGGPGGGARTRSTTCSMTWRQRSTPG